MSYNPYEAPQSSLDMPGDAPPLFNPAWSSSFAVLFGLPVACALHAMNWKNLGNDSMAKANWITAVIFIVVSLLLLIFVPAFWVFFLLIALFVWYFAIGKKQQKFVKENYGKDYPRRNMWLAALAGLGFSVIFFNLCGITMAIFHPELLQEQQAYERGINE
ncbi:MAG: hypothetical protein IKI22_03070 [Neisseriaceae bacterium]|nr:hypothetical protein [Neisseriaceae bacterium]